MDRDQRVGTLNFGPVPPFLGEQLAESRGRLSAHVSEHSLFTPSHRFPHINVLMGSLMNSPSGATTLVGSRMWSATHADLPVHRPSVHVQSGRLKHPCEVPIASSHAAHSQPWSPHRATAFVGQWQPAQKWRCTLAGGSAMGEQAMPSTAKLARVMSVPNPSRETSGPLSCQSPEEAAVRALKSMIWHLGPNTRNSFKDSLYRICR